MSNPYKMSPDQSVTKESESIFSIAFLILIIPAYIYLCSYMYEKGACTYYEIPGEFIRPDLTTNLYFSIALLFTIYFTYYLPHSLSFLIFYDNINKRKELLPFLSANTLLLICVLAAIKTVTYEIDWPATSVLVFIGICVANTIAYVQFNYLKRELKQRKYNEIAQTWNDNIKTRMPILDYSDILGFRLLVDGMTKKQRHIMLILAGIAGFSFLVGRGDAYNRTSYEVSQQKENFLLLRKYGDDMILRNYDPTTNRLGDSLLILKIGSDNSQIFRTSKVGKLQKQ